MGNLLSQLPSINIFGRSTFQSNCCNKNEISSSYTKYIHCKGSGKLFINSFINNDIDEKRNRNDESFTYELKKLPVEEILVIADAKS